MSPSEIRNMLRKQNMTQEDAKSESEQRRSAMVKKLVTDLKLENSIFGILIPESAQPVPPEEDYAYDEETGEKTRAAEKEKAEEDRYAQKRDAVVAALKLASAKRMVEIFPKAEIERCRAISLTMASDNRSRVKSTLKLIEVNDGMREMPTFKGIKKTLDGMKRLFGNFSDVLDEYIASLTFAGVADASSMRIPPFILNGGPGIGKTAFCMAFAKALGLPFLKLSAGGMQSGAVLAGTASHWSNSQVGEVFNLLAHQSSSSGCAVLFLDEADKLNTREDYNILPSLLDLLEPESARTYRDESLCMTFDASRLIIILASNYPEKLDPTLMSRCKFRTIESPGAAQKLAVSVEVHKGINASLPKAKRTSLDMISVEKMVQSDMDLRALIRCIQKACSDALMSGSRIASPVFYVEEEELKGGKKRRIGFA